ncbi:Adenylate cyclase-associated CAP [Ophiocordyceps camponoti-floridani]|uniref:Adenylate cyclase-associated CAP n=1 Tax=Ophiocordyceps camponoti-floridani TaxID=2030778 RepID=A0A8H4Q2K5_9HYPO|nr:Adenylate cyclase-associated CAP [Ophiocordyceps camponoti-floridani]
MNNLTTLIKRLEAATSRLEDIATATELGQDDQHTGISGVGESTASNTNLKSKDLPSEPLPEFIEEFDVLLDSSINGYVRLSKELGGVVAQQAVEVLKGFQEQRKFLLVSAKATKPDLTAYQQLLKPINEVLLSAVADGIMMLAWVTVDNRPYKHVDECLGSAQFFGNRVLKDCKEDPKQVEWVNSFYKIFRDLSSYRMKS